MTKILCAASAAFSLVLAISAPAAGQTQTLGPVYLYKGVASGKPMSPHADLAGCAAASITAKLADFSCEVRGKNIPAPPACNPPVPAPTTATIQCPSGTTGSWHQTTTITLSAPPACTRSTVLSPASAPAGSCSPVVASGPVIYADASAANDNGTGSAASPKKCIGSAASLLPATGGGTVIVKAGTYSQACDKLVNQGSGAAGAWNVVKAEVDGSAVITAGLALGLVDHFLQLEGLRWEDSTTKGITGRYVKLLRSTFKNGPSTGNTMKLSIGTNDKTPGAQYVLLEDVLVYGAGGRYDLLVYNADKIVLRRVVARHGDGWVQEAGAPQGSVSLYNSTDVLTQNLLILDSGSKDYFEAALYHPSNSRASANIRNIGAIIFNTTAGNSVGWDDHTAATGALLQDSLIYKGNYGVSIGGANHQGLIDRVTMAAVGGSGNWEATPGFTITNSLLWNAGEVKNIPTSSSTVGTTPPAGMKYLPQSPISGRGATITKRLGVSGTLYGEAGYDQATQIDLWPWPNQQSIQSAMCASAVTSLCAAPSITSYIWGALGNQSPF